MKVLMQTLRMRGLIVLVTVCLGSLTAGAATQVSGGNGESKYPVLLLPQYKERGGTNIDSRVGRVWKQGGGPVIDYEVGLQVGNHALRYAERVPNATVLRLGAGPRQIVLTLDLEHNTLVASMGIKASFTASNVKTRRDVAEVLAMIYTYQKN